MKKNYTIQIITKGTSKNLREYISIIRNKGTLDAHIKLDKMLTKINEKIDIEELKKEYTREIDKYFKLELIKKIELIKQLIEQTNTTLKIGLPYNIEFQYDNIKNNLKLLYCIVNPYIKNNF